MSETTSDVKTPDLGSDTGTKSKKWLYYGIIGFVVFIIILIIIAIIAGIWMWSRSSTMFPPSGITKTNSLDSITNTTLTAGQTISSPSSTATLGLTNGRLVVTVKNSIANSAPVSGTVGVIARLNPDGSLSLSDANNNTIYTTGSIANAQYYLTISDTGVLTLTNNSGTSTTLTLPPVKTTA